MSSTPWSSGPGEILRHALELLKDDTDRNRRLAMLSIDNSVELMIKTYLGLPRRANGLNIPRNKYNEFCESFPKLLDALEEYASSKLEGVELAEIEWYHRLRNQLYHQGNGLTVEREKVTIYAQLARVLFKNLFGTELQPESRKDILGGFLDAWSDLEVILNKLWSKVAPDEKRKGYSRFTAAQLYEHGVVDKPLAKEIFNISNIRNNVVHTRPNANKMLTAELVKRVKEIANQLAEFSE